MVMFFVHYKSCAFGGHRLIYDMTLVVCRGEGWSIYVNKRGACAWNCRPTDRVMQGFECSWVPLLKIRSMCENLKWELGYLGGLKHVLDIMT